MMPTVSSVTFTYKGDKKALPNCLNSLIDLDPDEVCILDTTTPFDEEFHEWIRSEVNKRGLRNLKLKWDDKFIGNYSRCRNLLIDMVTSDWFVLIDSDEMLTLEVAKGMRQKISELPPEALCLRTQFLDLLDDNHIVEQNLWKGRPPLSVHARIFKRGSGKNDEKRPRHAAFHYEGRITIPFNSPLHPKKDWVDHYMVHLWLYKDNPLINWSRKKWENKTMMEGTRKSGTFEYVRQRRWKAIEIPEDLNASWREIVWD